VACQIEMALTAPWVMIHDADPRAVGLYNRHYSARRCRVERGIKKFVGPGEHIVLMTPDATALFVWRKFIDRSGQRGVNCAVFRNESPGRYLSSELILAAEPWAWDKWPGARLYTYVNARKVRRKRDPGRCFMRAGWRRCGETKGGLVVLEKMSDGGD
jgi:hypothetical protein